MVICPFICRTHFMSKNVTRKLGATDPGSTLTFELYFFDIKWILQLNGQIIIKFLLWESIMLLILNQSPRGRIFHFHNLFPITLKREKKFQYLVSGRPGVDPKFVIQNIFQGRPQNLKNFVGTETWRYECNGVEYKFSAPGGSMHNLKLFSYLNSKFDYFL